MALLLLRHALSIGDGDSDSDGDDASTFFAVSRIFQTAIYDSVNAVVLLQAVWYLFTAFLASGCWFSSALLHYGLGYQYIAASKAETGK